MKNEFLSGRVKNKWNIDTTHSKIGFQVKHLMITNISGNFREYNASIYTIDDDFMTSEIDLFINPSSIDTGSETRDEHLKSADFFDVINFNEITFIGDTYEKLDQKDKFELFGNLTIKGITKKIQLNIEFSGVIKDPWGNKKAGFTIQGLIDRKDWNLTWNTLLEAGGVMISDEVYILCDVQLIQAAQS